MPSVNYILNNTTGLPEMRKQLCKSYVSLAKAEFKKKHKRWPGQEDAQEVYDIYEAMWRDYYIDKPLRVKENRIKGHPVWQYGIKYRIDVHYAMCRFLEHKYSKVVTGKYGNTYHEKSAAVIMEEMHIEFIDGHIIDSGLLDEWKTFVEVKRKSLPRHHKPRYTDFSHLAYNGVTDDL